MVKNMKNSEDHFGVPKENFILKKKWKNKKTKEKYLFFVYVPTRKEVATLRPEELTPILLKWMCHSPIEIIPSRTQIAEVRTALLIRDDVNLFTDLIKICENYIFYS